MSLIDFIYRNLSYVLDSIVFFFFRNPLALKFLIYLFSLALCLFFIYQWVKLEIKNQDEIGKWKGFFTLRKRFRFYKNSRKIWNKVKSKFLENKKQGLIYALNYLDYALGTLGYEGDIDEKIQKINPTFINNLEDLKKAIEITKILKETKRELSDEEYFLVFKQFEFALEKLKFINQEDFLALNQE